MDGQGEGSGRALREDLRRLADQIRQLDAGGRLPEEAPLLLAVLAEVRSRIIAYQVQGQAPPEDAAARPEPPWVQESRRIVNDAVDRAREAEKEWIRQWELPGDSVDL